jgi:LysM repeat protein
MRHWKRLFYYLIINVLVSACTVLVILSYWDRARAPILDQNEPDASFPVNTDEVRENTPVPSVGMLEASESIDTFERNQTSEAATSQPEITATVSLYQVRTGDTLGAIAARFSVSVEAILEANDLTDANKIDIGQTLIIPGQPIPTATRTPLPAENTATPTRTPTFTPSPALGEAQVNIDSVVGAGDLATERVLLRHTGRGRLTLEGWQLLDEDGAVFTFPSFNLYEAGSVYLYSKAGQPTPVQLYWGQEKPVWQTGETVTLKDAEGNIRATYRVP